jgi:hypothetical protein
MTQQLGRLDVVPVRNAWAHEAAAFTPWLAQNLDRLGEAIVFPLEQVQSEAPVAAFFADILARSVVDGSNVLIENQLEDSDHKHLGQIMTYLAGLSAHTVIWVAPKFREEHLSAIRWLNEHTAEPFSFLAVEIRVVRIGDSPLAPVFEVIERPNDWERSVQHQAREARPRGALAEFRNAFWTHLLDRHPAEKSSGAADGNSSRCGPLSEILSFPNICRRTASAYSSAASEASPPSRRPQNWTPIATGSTKDWGQPPKAITLSSRRSASTPTIAPIGIKWLTGCMNRRTPTWRL